MSNTPIDLLNSVVCAAKPGQFSKTEHWQRYYEPVPGFPIELPAPILGIMVLIWQLRAQDLQKQYSLKTVESCIDFIAWCMVSGRMEYQALREAALFWEALNRPALSSDTCYPEEDPAHAISWLMVLAIRDRPDLAFDLSSRAGRYQLLTWYVLNGRAELGFDDIPFSDWQMRYFFSPSAVSGLNFLQALVYGARSDLQKNFPLPLALPSYLAWFGRFLLTFETLAELNRPAVFPESSLPENDPAHAISRAMVLAIEGRHDLNFDLSNKQGRRQLLAWYIQHGRIELGFSNVPFEAWQQQYFFSPAEMPGLNRLQALIYEARPDLQKAFPLPSAIQDYLAWFTRFLTVETDLMRLLDSFAINAQSSSTLNTGTTFPFGVNIIGYVFGQLGIGEDARMAAQSLLTTDVPVTLVNFPPGVDAPQAERSMERYVGVEPIYAVNLFCLPGLEQGRYFAERGKQHLEGRYNIGYWPWELPQWPEEWRHLLSLVDEVWVYSQYVYDALNPVSPVPVRIMSVAVEIPEVSELTREDFSLPRDARLFLFAFDLNSSMSRKNPEACISAFLNAFPRIAEEALNAEQVGLVIKVHPPKTPNKDWDALKQLQQSDPRIHLIEQTLSKPDLLALYNICDSFVSLHRAEGFGRCIAEAMLLGKPVITTGFSGNLAFTGNENALLVNCKPLRLAEHDYPHGEGQTWVEPDVIHAAGQMRRIVEDAGLAKRLGDAGQHTVKNLHNTHVVGMRYANMLHDINLTYFLEPPR